MANDNLREEIKEHFYKVAGKPVFTMPIPHIQTTEDVKNYLKMAHEFRKRSR